MPQTSNKLSFTELFAASLLPGESRWVLWRRTRRQRTLTVSKVRVETANADKITFRILKVSYNDLGLRCHRERLIPVGTHQSRPSAAAWVRVLCATAAAQTEEPLPSMPADQEAADGALPEPPEESY